MNFKGKESVGLYMTGKILGENKFINQFNGLVHMDGSESDYQYKIFNPREFYGKQSFVDVYANITTNFQTLSIPSVDTVITNSSCGASNGSIVVKSIAGGGGPYGFQWYPAAVDGNNTDSIYNLPAGIYTCVITDSSDLSIFRLRNLSISGTQPLYIFGQPDSVKCKGNSDGSIQATINEGTQPYTYIWSDVTAQNNMSVVSTDIYHQEVLVNNLPAGNYNLTIVDSEGCTDSVPGGWTVHEPTLLTSSITSADDVLCFSECTGEATVTPIGGTPGYTYDWYDAPGSQSAADASALCEATYNVQVTDANGCLDTSQVIVGQPTLLDGFIAGFTDEQCFGASDGSASAGVNGGTYPYTYNWFNKGGDTDSAATGFYPGTFYVEIKDGNGCLDTAQVSIGGPTLLTSSMVDVVPVLCNGESTGEAQVDADGGTPAYSYKWYNASNQTTTRVTGLSAGTYHVEIEDDQGCFDTAQVTITQPPTVLSSSVTDTSHASCFNNCDGMAIVTPSGGTPGYTYDWYDAPGSINDSTINGLCDGTYNVRVTDANGCTNESTVSITEPSVLSGFTTQKNLKCNGVCEGEIYLTPTGGTGPYSHFWYDVPGTPSSKDITGLCAGTYHVRITDDNLCVDTIEATISEPDSISASIFSSTNILCHGDSTGGAAVTQTGGVGSYNHSWYDAHFDPGVAIISNLPAGTYNVRVSDANDCADTAEFTLTEPALPLSSSITDTVHILCKNDCNGAAEVVASGGTSDYNYSWYDISGSPGTLRVEGLCDGTYHVKVTDLNGCLDTSEVVVLSLIHI